MAPANPPPLAPEETTGPEAALRLNGIRQWLTPPTPHNQPTPCMLTGRARLNRVRSQIYTVEMPLHNFLEGSSVIVHSSRSSPHLNRQIGPVESITGSSVLVEFDAQEHGTKAVLATDLVILHQQLPDPMRIHGSIYLPEPALEVTTVTSTGDAHAPAMASSSSAAPAAPKPPSPVPQYFQFGHDTNVPALTQYNSHPHLLPAATNKPLLHLHPPPRSPIFTHQATIINPGEDLQEPPRQREKRPR